ncbi:MAG TPA: hypothetical protein VFH03_08445 [Actinoplanes sp.]|nr:hypothetical protein [Actinoplanes sp.]
MSGWHLDDDLARRYAAGLADPVLAASIETHAMTCPLCRERLAATVPDERLSEIWNQVTVRLDSPLRRIVAALRSAKPSWRARMAILVIALSAMFLPAFSLSWSADSLPGDTAPVSAPGAYLVDPASQAADLPAAPGETGLALWLAGGRNGSTPDGDPPDRVVLDLDVADLLGIGPATVGMKPVPGGRAKVIPRAAVVGGASGSWVYTHREPHLLVRERIDIDRVERDVVVLAAGPPAGTPIVTFTVA